MTQIKNETITLLEQLSADNHGPLAASILQLRSKVLEGMERSYRSLLLSPNPGGLSLAERAWIARETASSVLQNGLTRHYDALLNRQLRITGESAPAPQADGRFNAMLRHTQLIAAAPSAATREDLVALSETGFAIREIVTLAQLAGFVSYQARIFAGLQLFTSTFSSFVQVVPEPAANDKKVFTLDVLRWEPWLPPVTLESATAEQLETLVECGAIIRDSPYFRLLAHAPESLRERTRLYNGILFESGGLPRAEREFATICVSRINGCAYCASVHARRFAELTKATEPIQTFLESGETAQLPARLQAIQQFATRATRRPEKLGTQDQDALVEAGFTPLEVLDIIQTTALFAWANRLMLTLGQPEHID